MNADQLLSGLDAEQRDAVTSTAAPLAIIATAGSGKTTVLTRRIAYRIATGTASAKHVLALTFTRDAAGELRRRLRRFDLREPITAGTFHAIARQGFRDLALQGRAATPNIAPDRVRLARECIAELKLDVEPSWALADLDWARARLVTPEQFDAASRVAKRRSSLSGDRFVAFAHAFERLKRRKGVVDFDDLLEKIVHEAAVDSAFRDQMQWWYRHIFVDEAQDLNPLQHAVLDVWRGDRSDVCLVGDPRQAIYGWNGADSGNLERIAERLPGITVINLTTNYRCTPQVVAAGSAALAQISLSDTTRSNLGDGPPVSVQTYDSDTSEAAAIAQQVRSQINHVSPRDVAILARTNEQLGTLQRALDAAGIDAERSAGRSPIEVIVAEATRAAANREHLAAWATEAFDQPDPLRRRVAEEVDRYLSANASGGFRQWVENNDPFADLETDRRDAVSLLTFHAAKGREWSTVFVTGVEDGLVPHTSAVTPALRDEEARLLYVAITRAARTLVVSSASERKGRNAQPSPWLEAIAQTGDVAPYTPPPRVQRVADPLEPLRQWRARIARAGGVPETSVCNDRVLRSLRERPPVSSNELAERLGLTAAAAARLPALPTD